MAPIPNWKLTERNTTLAYLVKKILETLTRLPINNLPDADHSICTSVGLKSHKKPEWKPLQILAK